MTDQVGPSDKGKRNNRAPDPGSWTRSEVDKEISGLLNALDEHLRGLDSPSSPPQAKVVSPLPPPPPPPPPRPSYQCSSSNVSGSPGGSDHTKPTGTVFFAVLSGLVFGIGIGATAYMSSLGKFSAPPSVVPAGQGTAVKPSPAPQPKQVRPSAPTDSAPDEQPRSKGVRPDSRPEAPPSTDSATAVRWQACLDQERRDADPPQAGETWWPVVGPSDSLDDARRHCRADAFINRSGNAQISSFRDRETATAFAEQLTQDSSHPWSFWVGDVSVR